LGKRQVGAGAGGVLPRAAATVLELLDDECRDEGFFDLGQGRLPDALMAVPSQLLGQAAE
jgi:hypothetical protein